MNPFYKKPKSDLEIKLSQIAKYNPKELRAYLIKQGFPTNQLCFPYDLFEKSLFLAKKDSSKIPDLLRLHPDFELFAEVKEKLETKKQDCIETPTNVDLTNTDNTDIEVATVSNQIQEVISTPVTTYSIDMPSQNNLQEYDFFEVKDVCVYGIPLKYWLLGVSALLVLSILTCIFLKKD